MKKTTLLALAACAWPTLSLAQGASNPSPTPASVANPAAAVPATPYRSVFHGNPKAGDQEREDWRAANARVGQYARGHIDILKAEKAQATGAARMHQERP